MDQVDRYRTSVTVSHTHVDDRSVTLNALDDCQTCDEITSKVISSTLDTMIGSKEQVHIRRKVKQMRDFLLSGENEDSKFCSLGSFGDGFCIPGSDTDMMCISRNVIAMYPQHHSPTSPTKKTILFMKDADCRPGYVTLELAHRGSTYWESLENAMVPIEGSVFISSDIYRQHGVDVTSRDAQLTLISNGPCTSFLNDNIHVNFDISYSFQCAGWPLVADEWIKRNRLHEWPDPVLIGKVVQGGTHVVPVGDKCSADTFLQWRISFVTAERRLVHSLRDHQFKMYGLLKYFLKHITTRLGRCDEEDILCSYFIKTIIFHVVESSARSFWQEKNTLYCFLHCLGILTEWVSAGYCPHYFMPNNNLFKRKIQGENKRILLHILTDFRDRECRTFLMRTCFQPSNQHNDGS